MLKPALAIAMIGFVSIAAALPANAQSQSTPAISQAQATKIAQDNGLVSIREIELDDGKWEVEGRDQAGQEREIHIDATSGQVVRNKRD